MTETPRVTRGIAVVIPDVKTRKLNDDDALRSDLGRTSLRIPRCTILHANTFATQLSNVDLVALFAKSAESNLVIWLWSWSFGKRCSEPIRTTASS